MTTSHTDITPDNEDPGELQGRGAEGQELQGRGAEGQEL